MPSPLDRTPRADAVRNREALMTAAVKLFAVHGDATTFEDVAHAAGVGKGTLYRHFPSRDHLIAAIMQTRFDALTQRADYLCATVDDPVVAVELWLREFDQHPARSRGLRPSIGDGLADGESAIGAACLPMKRSFTKLVERAQAAGAAREDLDVSQLLTVVASLPEQFRDANGRSPFLDVVLRGLRS
jgi:AcrR family transcriptional regulator